MTVAHTGSACVKTPRAPRPRSPPRALGITSAASRAREGGQTRSCSNAVKYSASVRYCVTAKADGVIVSDGVPVASVANVASEAGEKLDPPPPPAPAPLELHHPVPECPARSPSSPAESRPTGAKFGGRSPRSRKVSVERFGRYDKAVRSACDRLEPVIAVEGCGGIVDGIDDHVSTAEIAGSDGGSGERTRQELGAESLTVEVMVEREPSDQVARNPLREAACLLLAERLSLDEVGHERVIRNDRAVPAVPDVGAGEVPAVAVARRPAEPVVERLLRALKG